MAAALTIGAALNSTAVGTVDLYQQGLIPIKPEGQELPFGQASGACKRFPPLPRRMASSGAYSAKTQEGPLGQSSTCSQKPSSLRFAMAMAKESGKYRRLYGRQWRSTMKSNAATLV